MRRNATMLVAAALTLGLTATASPALAAVDPSALASVWITAAEAPGITGLAGPFTRVVDTEAGEGAECLGAGASTGYGTTPIPRCAVQWLTSDPVNRIVLPMLSVRATAADAQKYVSDRRTNLQLKASSYTVYSDSGDRLVYRYNGSSPATTALTRSGNVTVEVACTGTDPAADRRCAEQLADAQLARAATLVTDVGTPTAKPAPTTACVAARKALAAAKKTGTARQIRLAKARVAKYC